MIKLVIWHNFINLKRFFYHKFIVIKYLFKGVSIRKPLHINQDKYFKFGKGIFIDSNSRLDCYKGDKNPILEIEDNVQICFNFTALCSSKLHIGKNTLIASNVFITTENHGNNPLLENYCKQELISKDVYIGSGCWIGEKVCILPGVNIGNHSIIGAGSIVTKDIPPFSIAVGNPAKVIKKFNTENNRWEKI